MTLTQAQKANAATNVLHADLQFFAAAPKQRADLHLKGQLSYYLK